MLNVSLDKDNKIAILEPHGPLAEADFDVIRQHIDPYIAEHGALKGLMISTREFPGWDSFAALSGHIKFVKDHHKKLSKVAIVTDSKIGDFAESIANHFVSAEVKHFAYDLTAEAAEWLVAD